MRRLIALVALLLAAGPAVAAQPINESDRGAIVAALGSYAASWASLDADALASHWDLRDESPLYLAEEVDAVLADMSAIRAYWKKNAAAFSGVTLAFSDYRIKPIDRDTALVAFHMDWRIAFKNPLAKPIAADNRVVALMRREGKIWKLAAWIEAPLAPTVFLRKALENNAESQR